MFIGGNKNGIEPLQDDPMLPRETSWLLFPGGNLHNVCQSNGKVIQFNGNSSSIVCREYLMTREFGSCVVDHRSPICKTQQKLNWYLLLLC